MKINDIYELVKEWKDEDKSVVFSPLSGHYLNSYYALKPKNENQWIVENLKFIKDNLNLKIEENLPNFDYKISRLIVNLMAFAQVYENKEIFDFIKKFKLDSKVLYALESSVKSMFPNELRNQYYLSFVNLLESKFFNLNTPEIQEQIKKMFKKATIENNKKHYAHALFKVAEFFYEKRDTLNDKFFVLEMIEYYLITNKYVKSDLNKVLEMTNWREKELLMSQETIDCFCIVKKINPVKIGIVINEHKSEVERMLKDMHNFLQKKLYTHEQHLAIDITEKAADKVFIISFEKINSNIEIASEFISYFTEKNIKKNMYEEVWSKIEFKNKINKKLPEKNTCFVKNKI